LTFLDFGAPTWTSALSGRVRAKGPERATAGEWLKFVLASAEHGISKDEIQFSGIAHWLLGEHDETDVLTKRQVLAALSFKTVTPKLQMVVDDRFRPSAEWAQCVARIEPRHHRKLGLFGDAPHSVYVVRYRHRSLGWAVALARHADLMHTERTWWLVLNAKGMRVADQPEYGFNSSQAAMAHASTLLQRQFVKSARARHKPNWERFSLQGLGTYAELLVVLPDWPDTFISPVHFPGVRNLLIHLRTNVCQADDGSRLLFLDEVQSDWHASQVGGTSGAGADPLAADPEQAPFARDWPLLALKFALWWATREGVSGLAWSTPSLHQNRWADYGPPTEVYRKGLPEAAGRLARVLQLELGEVTLSSRRIHGQGRPGEPWRVLTANGIPACRGFAHREQAERFAQLTGAVDRHVAPVLRWQPGRVIQAMPLFGVGDPSMWAVPAKAGAKDPPAGLRRGTSADAGAGAGGGTPS